MPTGSATYLQDLEYQDSSPVVGGDGGGGDGGGSGPLNCSTGQYRRRGGDQEGHWRAKMSLDLKVYSQGWSQPNLLLVRVVSWLPQTRGELSWVKALLGFSVGTHKMLRKLTVGSTEIRKSWP